MVSWMAADSDPGILRADWSRTRSRRARNVDGPSQVFSRINQNPQFSAERTLLGQGGSDDACSATSW